MHIKIKIGPTQSTILRANTMLLSEIAEICSYQKISERAKQYSRACQSGWDGKVSLVDKFRGTVPTGLIPKIVGWLKAQGHTVELEKDLPVTHESPRFKDVEVPNFLRSYQVDAIKAMIRAKRGILQLPTGCHAKGTKILMYDGSWKLIEDILIDDLIMGPDSTPRKVLKLHTGFSKMYEVSPIKGKSFIVNEDHLLFLKNTENKTDIILTVKDYLNKTKWFKHLHKLVYSNGIDFQEQNLPLDPYVLGVLIGDGSLQSTPSITNPDVEIFEYIKKFSEKNNFKVSIIYNSSSNRCLAYSISDPTSHKNRLMNILRDLKLNCLSKYKYIPNSYKINSRTNRLEILAGLLDTDGYYHMGYFEYSTASKQLAEDVKFLAQSLGFKVPKIKIKNVKGYTQDYYILNILGNVDFIPTKVKRKQASKRRQIKNVLYTGFSLEEIGDDHYYGFSCDKDNLYIMEDFLISHNSGKSITSTGLVASLKRNTIFFAHTIDLIDQTKAVYEKIFPGIKIGKIGNQVLDPGPITIASIQTVSSWLIPPNEPVQRVKELTTDFQKRYSKYQVKLEEWEKINERATKFLAQFPVAIFDECFSGNTLIDEKRIDSIKIGDYISSYNHITNVIEKKRVYNVLKSKPKEIIKMSLTNGKEIICTSKHPFWTDHGYLPACLLEGIEVYEKTNTFTMQEMRKISDMSRPKRLSKLRIGKKKCSLLFSRMQKRMVTQAFFRCNDSNKSEVWIDEKTRKQWNVSRRESNKSFKQIEGNRTQTKNSRREWEGSNNCTTIISQTIELGNGSNSKNRTKKVSTKSLQNRYSQCRVTNSDRNRWKFTRVIKTERTRSEKREILKPIRVESITFLKSTSDGTFGGMLSGGYVFNLEVEDNHNYYANNILVHNCQHLSADTFYTTAQACTGAEYLFALSATPYRDDGADLLIEAGSGSTIYSLSISDVVEMGYLLPAEIHIHEYKPLPPMNLSNVYAEQYKICITMNDNRNDKIVEIVKQEYEQDHSTLILCREIGHIETLFDMIKAQGVPCSMAHAKSKDRATVLEDFKSKKVMVMIASGILDEGVDVPAIDTVILAGAGRSRVKSYQRIGRALRLYPGKEKAIIHDFKDEMKPFSYHFNARMGLYNAEKCFTVIKHYTKKQREVVRKATIITKKLDDFGITMEDIK